ncbi:hypothetical protein HQ535_15315 [bacterium]|nr:hypothetical protein [bacterium]
MTTNGGFAPATEALPYTGMATRELLMLAAALIAAGILLIVAARLGDRRRRYLRR